MADTNAPKNDQDEWGEEIKAESQVKLDTIGDVFTGRFLGMDSLPSGIVQAHFNGTREFNGEDYFINAGFDLRKKLSQVTVGSETRIELTEFRDVGQAKPMSIHKVQSRA
jgi:hypothetical protein